jgi:ubiquinone/menaquinone biosynthesis C-methylase UbiE
MLGHPGEWSLVQCRQCGFIYLNPRPRDMAPYYEGSYLPFEHRPKHNLIPRRPKSKVEEVSVGAAGGYYLLLEQVTSNPSGRLLDVGCATGDFLLVAATAGWTVTGCDLSAFAVEQAQKRLSSFPDTQVLHGALESLNLPDASFDIITLWHSIEHVSDPKATLQEVHRLLKPDGQLILQTPAWLSLESQFFKHYWAGLDFPRHLSLFSMQTLKSFLEQTGFGSVQPLYQTSYYFSLTSLVFIAQRYLPSKLLSKLYQLLSLGPMMLYTSPFFRVVDHYGLGSLLSVVATKTTSF